MRRATVPSLLAIAAVLAPASAMAQDASGTVAGQDEAEAGEEQAQPDQLSTIVRPAP